MKREHDRDDSDRRNKRQKPDGFTEALSRGRFELRLLLNSKSAGAIIGKKGENIKRIRSQFDGTFAIPDSLAPERVCTIVNSIEVCGGVLNDIFPRIDEGADDSKSAMCDIRLLVHQSHAGGLIGKQGSRIRELRDNTQTRIKVFSATAPRSTDRVIMISGEPPRVIHAITTIMNEMKEIPIKGAITYYNPDNYDPHAVPDYGGYLPNGPPPPQRGGGPSRGGGRDRFDRGQDFGGRGGNDRRGGHGGPGGYGGAGGHGGASGYGGAGGHGGHMQGGMPYMNDRGGMMQQHQMAGPPMVPPPQHYDMGGGPSFTSQPPPPIMRNYGYPGGNPPPGPPGGFPMPAGVQTTQVTIPNDLAGTIIGKSGEKINRIRGESHATIVVEPGNVGNDERIITITGTPQEIHAAQYMLQQCVRQSPHGRRYIEGGR